ncbi:MAG: hypothetical protein ACI9BD_001220 [Candidatus Marinamargulisbacteria bacterium]
MSVQLPSSGAPQFQSNVSNSASNLANRHLKSPEFKNVLESLGIKPREIISISEHKGVHADLHINDVNIIQVNQNQAQALIALGLPGAEVAIVVSADEEIKLIKKKLKQITESMLDKETLSKLGSLLGFNGDDALVFMDETGGLLLIRSSMTEIEEALEDD